MVRHHCAEALEDAGRVELGDADETVVHEVGLRRRRAERAVAEDVDAGSERLGARRRPLTELDIEERVAVADQEPGRVEVGRHEPLNELLDGALGVAVRRQRERQLPS